LSKRDVWLKLVDENVSSQADKLLNAIENPLEPPKSVEASTGTAASGTARASWSNALWLYNVCKEFSHESASSMSGTQIAMIALRELIWIRGQGYDEEWFEQSGNRNKVLWRLLQAFKGFKNNSEFVGRLLERCSDLAADDNVNKENIEMFEQ
jgi:hypothetical protein